jgi:hypothetical protein
VIGAKKKIQKLYKIKQIDFIEIAGEDSTVLIIGFRSNQNDFKINGDQELNEITEEEIYQSRIKENST